MPDLPWDAIIRSQRAAVGLLSDTVSTLVEMGRTGVTRPEQVLSEVTALVSAMRDLAGSTARPLEFFVESQQQLAETMEAFAVLQRQLADVMERAAANQAQVVQALELMTSPVLAMAHRVRPHETPGDEDPPPEPEEAAEAKTRRTAKDSRAPRAES
jgi:hypothetical protein